MKLRRFALDAVTCAVITVLDMALLVWAWGPAWDSFGDNVQWPFRLVVAATLVVLLASSVATFCFSVMFILEAIAVMIRRYSGQTGF
jgi:hypothetical protein